jgi:hypothetical protein
VVCWDLEPDAREGDARARSVAGIDAVKSHHCVVIDAGGTRLLSRRVANDEIPLLELISEVTALGE